MSGGGSGESRAYVSRGGTKLRHALDEFGIEPAGWRCVDLGCSTGGFTDCLLEAGAAHVTAVDTGYGVIDYRLRMDGRVTVMERANALHAPSPGGKDCDCAVIDMGWTVQARAVPCALGWVKEGGCVVSLVKPHYEARALGMDGLLDEGVLGEDDARRVCDEVVRTMGGMGVEVMGVVRSPILGGKTRGKRVGNVEFLAHLRVL